MSLSSPPFVVPVPVIHPDRMQANVPTTFPVAWKSLMNLGVYPGTACLVIKQLAVDPEHPGRKNWAISQGKTIEEVFPLASLLPHSPGCFASSS